MTTGLPRDLLHRSDPFEASTTIPGASSVAECVYVFSRQGVCQWSNVVDPSGAGVLGNSIRDLLPDGSLTGDQVLSNVVETGRGAAFISSIEARGEASGTTTGVAVRLSPIADASGRVETVVASCGERAGPVRVEEQRAMRVAASEVAHDFSNVVAAILGHTQALMAQITNEDHLRSLRLIDRMARDSAKIVKRVPDFAKLDSGTVFEDVDVNQLIENVLQLTRQQSWSDDALSKGHPITVNSRPKDVPLVWGNYAELCEVLMSVVTNACEAIDASGTIGVAVEASQDLVQIAVSDTGRGMAPETAQRAFEPFFTTKGVPGAGLGLTVAFGIVIRHNGRMELESEQGVGTTVRIWLPVAPAAGPPATLEGQGPVGSERGASVLVIDDDPLIRRTMADLLALDGHEATLAADGEEGISLFESGEYDVVFTDLAMPGMSGWDVAAAAKAKRPQIPVVILTGWGAALEQKDIESAGVDAVVTKPFGVKAVLGLVRSLVGERTPAV
ncbi:MAG: response regulator [Chloroflexi bacterium]|nr:response regulator [Chloroflexota bacterium]